MDRIEWTDLFLTMAFLVAQRSPDSQTKHGAVLVDEKNRIVGMGFNGFPRGCDDKNIPTTRPEKYPWVIHSEPNCILNSSSDADLTKCTMYITGKPCLECLKIMVQAGIKRIIYGHVGSNCIKVTETETDKVMNAIIKQTGIKMVEYKPSWIVVSDTLANTYNYVQKTNKKENIN